MELKVLTLNTWQEMGPWRDRWEVTFEGIKRLRPDLVGFQEVFSAAWAKEVQHRTGFPACLTEDPARGQIFLTKFPVIGWGVEKLPKSPLEDYDRFVLWARLKIKQETLGIINTHLSWKLEDGPVRKKQVEAILALIEEKIPSKEEVLLMGDLNSTPDSPELAPLFEQGKFVDLFFKKHPDEAGITWDNRHPYVQQASVVLPDRRIDFILQRGEGPLLKGLVSCDLVFTEPNAKGVWATDHYGMFAEWR